MRSLVQTLAAVGLVAAPLVAARADLILVSPNIVTVGGTGLGAVNTVLTISSQGNNTTEAGCVGRNATNTADVFGQSATGTGGVCSGSAGDVMTGASQTQTRLLSDAGITSGSNFAVFFNAAEPAGNSITLNTLTANFYDAATGTLLHSANYTGAPHTFDQTATGTGNTGYLFALDPTEAATVQGFITSKTTSGIRVGLSASASDATGGNETFFIFNNPTSVSATPEPASLALLATGLVGLVGFTRRRRNG